MKLLFDNCLSQNPSGSERFSEPLGIGLGNFDGLHIGHMVLINTLIDECKFNGIKSMLYTFRQHPDDIVRKNLLTSIITDTQKKVEILGESHLDYLFLDEFDENFSHMEPDAFIKEILVGRFGVRLAVAGFDYSFGYKGRGGVEMLKNYGKMLGFKVIIIPSVRLGHEVVSSTLIRQYVKAGNMQKVCRMLGRHFSISGPVVKGAGNGKKMGIPTANIKPSSEMLIPAEGVYITRTEVGGLIYPSITNVGKNPTFNFMDISIETYIFDFSKDIYNSMIEIFFEKRIRGEVKFDSAQLLMERINKDIASARRYFSK